MSRSYQFGNSRISPARRELWRAGKLVALPPQAFDFLAYLIEHHDRAVGRDELVAAVWGKTEVSDTLLGQTVLRLRRELGDDAKEQRLLRTIPRFGYRWVAPFEIDDAEAALAQPTQTQLVAETTPVANAMPASRARRWLAVAAVTLTIAVGAAVLYWYRGAPHIEPPQSSALSAVLPAQIEASTQPWMRLGVMDMIATQLRTAGMPSVPSDDIIALLKVPAANGSAGLRKATSARWLVSPQVHHADADWQVTLAAEDGAGQQFRVEGQARDVVLAARIATDKLLAALGARAAPASADVANTELIERVDAAVLADDPGTARQLITQASAEQQHSPELRVRLAKLDFRAGKLDAAEQRLVALLDEAPARTAPVLRASIFNGLGAVAIRSDKPEQAQHHFDAAIALLETGLDRRELGLAYLGRAAASADRHRFDAARTDYAQARVAFREANDPLALLRVMANEGFLDLDQDRPAQALPQLRAAGEGFRQWNALNEAIFVDIGQIGCQLALLDAHAALETADAAGVLAQRIDNPGTRTSLEIARARVLVALGRWREARLLLDDVRSKSNDPVAVAAADSVLAALEMENNNVEAAADMSRAAVAALAAPSYATLRANAWLIATRAAMRTGDAAAADAVVTPFEAWARQSDEPRARVYALLARAEQVRKADGDWRGAFANAQQLAERDGVPSEIVAVTRSHAWALLADGDLKTAQIEIGRLSRWSDQDFDCALLEARLFAALGRDEARQTALARARSLAGERAIPTDALTTPIAQARP